MTTAYDLNLPCLNPSCKSHGASHPNCHCYQGLAQGGDVTHFCNSNKTHKKECQYFADGGIANPIPSSDPSIDPAADASAAMTTGARNLFSGNMNYDQDVKKGHKHIKDHVNNLFDRTSSIPLKPDLEAREKLDKYMKAGGLNNELTSGNISHNPAIPPVQNTMLNASKGTVANYLNTLRPVPDAFQSKLAFDDASPNKDQERSYNNALDIANVPLSVLHHINNGTLEPEHVKHFNTLYPDLNDHLQKKITERITQAQIDGDKPSYKVRQGLSMFMGTPLSGEMTQPNMAAAQAVFVPQQPQPAPAKPVTKNKKNTSSLKDVGSQYQTASQASEARASQTK